MAGSIHKFETPGGKTRYRARYRDGSGQQHEKRFEKKVDAARWLSSQTSAVVTGSHSAPARGRLTVGEWVTEWSAAQVHLKASTRYRYNSVIRNQVLPTWGRVRISQVEHAAVARWVSALTEQGLAASTVRQAHCILSQSLAYAVADRRISVNPAIGVRLPRLPPAKQRFLSRAQITAMMEAAGPYADTVLTLAHLGLRFGELAGLTVGDLDVDRRRLHVHVSATEVGGEIEVSDTKTHRDRWIPVPAFLVDALTERTKGRRPDDLLFTAPEGGRLLLRNWRARTFDPACKAAGITDLSPHDLRHTAASLAIGSGAHVKLVQRLLGHASAAMTLDVYAGLFDDDMDALAVRMDEAHRRHAEA